MIILDIDNNEHLSKQFKQHRIIVINLLLVNILKSHQMGQTYCNTCCVNEKLPNFQHQMDSYIKKDDHTPLETFAIKVRQMIQINSVVKQQYAKFKISHIPERTGTKFDTYYLFNYAAYYHGEWKNGLPHGIGNLVYDDGSLYEGCFKQGYAECMQAIYIYNNGSFYRGQVKSNKANGIGQLSTPKFYYKGQWFNDLPHGSGREVYGSNSYYEGELFEGKKQGLGIYYWNAKQYYSGNFHNDLMDGEGQLVLKDYTYKGEFKKGFKQGRGIIINTKNQWKYEGYFFNNQMNGYGKYCWSDGTVFEGQFLNDQRTKQGKITLPNNTVIQCSLAEQN